MQERVAPKQGLLMLKCTCTRHALLCGPLALLLNHKSINTLPQPGTVLHINAAWCGIAHGSVAHCKQRLAQMGFAIPDDRATFCPLF